MPCANAKFHIKGFSSCRTNARFRSLRTLPTWKCDDKTLNRGFQGPTRASSAPPSSPSGKEEEDLWQYPDREAWYLPKFAADDQPDWNGAEFLSSRELAPGVKEVVLNIEISRERVPLRNAYKHIGQQAVVRVNGSSDQVAMPSSPPFSPALLRPGLLTLRGDMTAGEVKTASEEGSVKAELVLVVRQDTAPELYKCSGDDLFEVGPFAGWGLNLRGAIAGIYACPTIVLFVQGPDGLATARALVTATSDSGGLNLELRNTVRVYYRAKNQASVCYDDELAGWEERYGAKVIVSTRDTFLEMFDDDDTLVYEPDSTAAIILTGTESNEDEDSALEVCQEAEIAHVIRQSEEQTPTRYLKYGNE